MTLLEITQNILSAMDSDEVNSISDTVESLQVAEVVKETYQELLTNIDVPELKILTRLDSLSDPDHPNYLAIPNGIKEIFWIKYDWQTDSKTDFQEVKYLDPEVFIQTTVKRRNLSHLIEIADIASGVPLYIFTNANPMFWTTFDDKNIVFDSFNQSLDSTLKQSKSMVWAQRDAEFRLEDSYVPLMDANLFPLLLAEAKNTCFINFKQVSNAAEAAKAHRQRVRAQNDMWRANQRKPYHTPDYGRRSR